MKRILQVAQIGAPRQDPAFDRRHKDWDRLVRRYSFTRHEKHLDALPVIEGKKVRRFAVGLLTPKAYAELLALQNRFERAHLAVRAAVTSFTDEQGREVRATFLPRSGTIDIAEEGWLDTLHEVGGHNLIVELAEVALRRHEIGDFDDADDFEGPGAQPDPLDRYALPPGITLAPSIPSGPPAGAPFSNN